MARNHSNEVCLKIKDDWNEKREFIYLKNIQEKERFILKTKDSLKIWDDNIIFNMIESLRILELNPKTNLFNVELCKHSKYALQLKKKIVIEIANNEIIQNILPKLEKQVMYAISLKPGVQAKKPDNYLAIFDKNLAFKWYLKIT
uniref:Uncharacterized protein n=1 Tax=Meloidogyne hapla TaxID=6305 RepID=A0A1I8BQ13_MELHA